MRIHLLTGIALTALLTTAANAQPTASTQQATTAQPAPAPSAAPVHLLEHVAGSVWRFRDRSTSSEHIGLVMVTRAGAVVVDPLNTGAAEWLKGELAARFNGVKVVEVVYSHKDWDHAAGARAFGAVPVVARYESLGLLELPAEAAARSSFQREYADVARPTVTWTTPVRRIVLGGRTMELHFAPNRHAADYTLVWFPAERILFTPDIVSPGRLPYRDIPDYDTADVDHILKQALAFKPRYVVGGHGGVGTPADITALSAYYAELRGGVADGIARRLSLAEIKQRVTMDRYRDWDGYARFRELNVEGMYAALSRK